MRLLFILMVVALVNSCKTIPQHQMEGGPIIVVKKCIIPDFPEFEEIPDFPDFEKMPEIDTQEEIDYVLTSYIKELRKQIETDRKLMKEYHRYIKVSCDR